MNSELTIGGGNASLIEMRADPKRFPRIKSVPREQAVREISKTVSQAFLYRGQQADPTNIQFISAALVDELLLDRQYGAPNISFDEIRVVVKRAVLGGSEMFGISVASLYKVIMDYIKGEGNRIQHEVADYRRRQREKALDESPANPMLMAYAGQFSKDHSTR